MVQREEAFGGGHGGWVAASPAGVVAIANPPFATLWTYDGKHGLNRECRADPETPVSETEVLILPKPKILFADEFEGPSLNLGNWYPYYLPHWSSQERSRASYRIQDSYLRLSIDEGQLPWCPEFDGDVKVSNLQTGQWSGPNGSVEGQHRFRPDLVVRKALPERRLFLPHYCRLEMRARARLNPWNLAALWLIGFEDAPDRSGEITLFEVFGHGVESDGVKIGRGIKKINDPNLVDEIDTGKLPIIVSDWHIYAMDWTAAGIDFLIDGKVVTTTRQSPAYPMQLMLNFYDLPGDYDRTYPINGAFEIDYLRAWKSPKSISPDD
jgi:hypothetical protein